MGRKCIYDAVIKKPLHGLKYLFVLLSISEFIGHFHPLLVHLPIGILLTGIFLQWLSLQEKYKGIQQAVPVVFFFGMLAAIFSCITGYILSNNDDYDKTIVNWHQWMGIAVALTSVLLYLTIRYPRIAVNNKILSLILLLLLHSGPVPVCAALLRFCLFGLIPLPIFLARWDLLRIGHTPNAPALPTYCQRPPPARLI